MKTTNGHLTYCTNIHAGENWPDHFAALQQYFPRIKNQLSRDEPMGIGLRLSEMASIEILLDHQLAIFKKWLDENNAYIFTMNGFPYGGFHGTVVKDDVHTPDWTTKDRLEYTKRLFTILAELLPEGMDGGVSTSPLSYRYWFDTAEALSEAKETATKHIIDVTEFLIVIHNKTGKLLHLDIEPEPDGILETGEEFINWYKNELIPAATEHVASTFGISAEEAEKKTKEHICICYDVCHFAIGYEPHAAVIKHLAEHGIKIGKFQISAALKANMPAELSEREAISNAFAKFNEPTYLHQVIAKTENGEFLRYRDLPQALEDANNPAVTEWRAHFHVPIFEKNYGLLESTQDDIVEVLQLHTNNILTNHLEVETYTWEVLSDNLKLPLQESISRELQWVKDQL
jgi:sugar phosphate isomerase/epimerase